MNTADVAAGWLMTSEDADEIKKAFDERHQMRVRIAELEAAIQTAIGSLERVYGDLPTHLYPGPPITIIENLRTALREPQRP